MVVSWRYGGKEYFIFCCSSVLQMLHTFTIIFLEIHISPEINHGTLWSVITYVAGYNVVLVLYSDCVEVKVERQPVPLELCGAKLLCLA